MGSPTDDQQTLTTEEMQAYKDAHQMTQDQYGKQSAIYGQMTKQFESIFAGGPSQTGFSDAERTDLDSQAVEGTAANFKGAAKALGDSEAARGGGTDVMEGGAESQRKEDLVESSAGEESREESGIKTANYQQGQQNWTTAAQGLQAVATGENPLGYEGEEIQSGKLAADEADKIAEQQTSWEAPVIGAAASIVGAGVGGWAGGAACPVKGAVILLATGLMRVVEKLQLGDVLLGYDGPETILSITPVKSKIVGVELENGKTVLCSPTHAFILAATKTSRKLQYVEATEAKGWTVLTRNGPVTVKSVKNKKMATVYNIITDGLHTYCADDMWCVGDDQ